MNLAFGTNLWGGYAVPGEAIGSVLSAKISSPTINGFWKSPNGQELDAPREMLTFASFSQGNGATETVTGTFKARDKVTGRVFTSTCSTTIAFTETPIVVEPIKIDPRIQVSIDGGKTYGAQKSTTVPPFAPGALYFRVISDEDDVGVNCRVQIRGPGISTIDRSIRVGSQPIRVPVGSSPDAGVYVGEIAECTSPYDGSSNNVAVATLEALPSNGVREFLPPHFVHSPERIGDPEATIRASLVMNDGTTISGVFRYDTHWEPMLFPKLGAAYYAGVRTLVIDIETAPDSFGQMSCFTGWGADVKCNAPTMVGGVNVNRHCEIPDPATRLVDATGTWNASVLTRREHDAWLQPSVGFRCY